MPKSTSSSDRVLRSRSNSRESASEICTTKSIRRKRTETVRLRAKFPWKPKGASEIRRSPRILEEIREALAETMNELHFPFIRLAPVEAPAGTSAVADAFSSLRWSTVSTPKHHLLSWRIGHNRKKHVLIPKYMNASGPYWNEPPSDAPDRVVMEYIVRLRRKWLWDPKFLTPTSWMEFAGVDWDHEPPFLLISRDSSDSPDRPKGEERPSQNVEVAQEQEPRTTRITCRPSLLKHSRCRGHLDVIYSLLPGNFILGHRMDVCAEQRHTRHKGCLECKEDSVNQDISPPNAICGLVNQLHPWFDDARILPSDLSEWHEAKDVGRLITNIVATDAFPCQWRATLNWPDILSLGSWAPLMDYTCQATHVSLGKSRIHPLLFAAVHYEEYYHEVACKKLALAFQSMMTLFILYYLDTRTIQDEPMPEWMVLFGVVYDEHGLDIRACYPSFWVLSPQSFHQSSDPGERHEGWGATELGVCDEHFKFLAKPAWERDSLFALLYRIQRHCHYVLEHLQCWDGYDRACSLLQSC